MKAIHPEWKQAVVTCACGNTFSVGTTISEINIEVCSNCHPFYTGQMKYLDTKGRVDAFMAKQAQAQTNIVSKSERRAQKKAAKVIADLSRPESLAEIRKAIKKSKSK